MITYDYILFYLFCHAMPCHAMPVVVFFLWWCCPSHHFSGCQWAPSESDRGCLSSTVFRCHAEPLLVAPSIAALTSPRNGWLRRWKPSKTIHWRHGIIFCVCHVGICGARCESLQLPQIHWNSLLRHWSWCSCWSLMSVSICGCIHFSASLPSCAKKKSACSALVCSLLWCFSVSTLLSSCETPHKVCVYDISDIYIHICIYIYIKVFFSLFVQQFFAWYFRTTLFNIVHIFRFSDS